MVTNQRETSPWKRQNDDDGGTPEVNNTVVSREKGEMDIEIEPEEKRTKGNDEGDVDELMQEVEQDVDCQEETSDGTHQEENLDEGEERQEEQEQIEEGNNVEYIGMWCTEL